MNQAPQTSLIQSPTKKPYLSREAYIQTLPQAKKDKYEDYNQYNKALLNIIGCTNNKCYNIEIVKQNITLLKGYYFINPDKMLNYYCTYYGINRNNAATPKRLIYGFTIADVNRFNYGIMYFTNVIMLCEFTGVHISKMAGNDTISKSDINFDSPLRKMMIQDGHRSIFLLPNK